MDAHTLFAYSTVATAPSPATSGTSLVVAAGQGALFPAVPFYATICPVGSAPLSTNAEVVRVTAKATDTFTITRAQLSTAARTVVVGDSIFQPILPLDFEAMTEIENTISADVTMTTAGTYYDGATVTPATGRWALWCSIGFFSVTSLPRTYTAKLWDGTTALSVMTYSVTGSAGAGQVSLSSGPIFVTGNGSTAYKVSATSTVNADHILGAAPFDKTTRVSGIRIG